VVTVNIFVPYSVTLARVRPVQLSHPRSLVPVGKPLPLENARSKGRMYVAAASNVAGRCLVVVMSALRYAMKVHVSLAVSCSRRDVSVDDAKRVCSVGKLILLVKLI